MSSDRTVLGARRYTPATAGSSLQRQAAEAV